MMKLPFPEKHGHKVTRTMGVSSFLKQKIMTKIIFNTRLLSLLCIVMLIGLETSCTKEDTLSSSQKVELFSFGPAGVHLGDTISFIGMNLDRVQEIVFVGDSVPKASFVSQSSTLIKVIVPQNATRGYVTLRTTTDGSIVTQTMIDFLVTVTLTSVPTYARPGDNITITGTDMTWVTEVWFTNNVVVRDTNFVSRSMSQIVVKVPLTAQTGPLTFNTAGTKPLSIISDSDLVVALPVISGFSPNPVARGSNLTITGSNLDLVMGVLFKGVTDTIKTFVSQSPTQLVVTVPQSTNHGAITLLPNSLVPVVSTSILTLVGDLPTLPPLAYPFYDDQLENNCQNWGWGTTAVDFSNTENVRDGTDAIKITYAGSWGAVKLANLSVASAAYSTLEFSIYGTAGTGGNTINIAVNGGANYQITVTEGQWTDFKLPLTDFGSLVPATITDVMFQETGWAGVIYMDRVGLN
jgi:hypothetical protein